jgi:hypothetical protein
MRIPHDGKSSEYSVKILIDFLPESSQNRGMEDLSYKFEPEHGTAKEYQGTRYLRTLMVVAVAPCGPESLVVLTRPGCAGIPDVVRVIKVSRYYRLTVLLALAEARSSPRWDRYRAVLFANQTQEA